MPMSFAPASRRSRGAALRRVLTRPRARASGGGLLDGLGLIGCREIEPLVVAAAAAELPMLLVGPHGTGKSLLLTRVAEALGLTWRHYNASLLAYDDLVGYPVPDGQGSLTWLRTPATIWDAEAVFLDEINRCRPELQNKLFPIIHERQVGGIPLARLRHRWSAMNPVADDGDDIYTGVRPLDPALADRFAFIVPMPDWRALRPEDQDRLLASDVRPVDPSAAFLFRASVEAARARYLASITAPDPAVIAYVRTVLRLLDDGGIRCSPRRGALLVRVILAVRATGLVTGHAAGLTALRGALPQRVVAGDIAEHRVIVAHRAARAFLTTGEPVPAADLLAIADPLDRAAHALEQTDLDPVLRSTVVADCYAVLPDGARHALAVHAFEEAQLEGLAAAVAADLGEAYAVVVTPHGEITPARKRTGSGRKRGAPAAPVVDREAALIENLVDGLALGGSGRGRADRAELVRAWTTARRRLASRKRRAAGRARPARPAAGGAAGVAA